MCLFVAELIKTLTCSIIETHLKANPSKHQLRPFCEQLIISGFPFVEMQRYCVFFFGWGGGWSTSATNESVLKVAFDHGKVSCVIKSHDRVVICQKVGDASVRKIIEFED
ncbi:hypothetical protein AQUCO_00200332v1 [Aquilegia coerulea]|uniref:Uncharacterized protein n=1 Tax=Aquilegia coerulea TaxID=218851 RepID=A0A2G5F2T0_AQUCA|nr:hypothetical protein AQUCO_00200332v1 [Aquilegia coerulea]